MRLNAEEKLKYSRIMFEDKQNKKQQIQKLSIDQLETLRSIYAHKICYQINNQNTLVNYYSNPDNRSIWMNIFCCCFPQYNQEQFNITTPVFLKRAFYPFLFWKQKFFQINDGQVQNYGTIWMVLMYSITLALATILTTFFVDPINYTHNYGMISTVFVVSLLFKFIQPLIHSGAIGCLGVQISNDECLMLSSYSLSLYIFPTTLCMVPSIYWRVMLLGFQALCRLIFLFRNYSTKLESRRYLLFILLLSIQLIYLVVVYQSFFQQASLGFGFTQGFAAVFGTTPTIQQTVQSKNPMAGNQTSNSTHSHHFSFNNQQQVVTLRHFLF